jgi:hypothetical protein
MYNDYMYLLTKSNKTDAKMISILFIAKIYIKQIQYTFNSIL